MAAVAIFFYLLFAHALLFFLLWAVVFAYSGFSHWIFGGLHGKHLRYFKLLLFLCVVYIFIGGFYLQWDNAIHFTAMIIGGVFIFFPIILLFFAWKEKNGLR